MAQFIVKNKLGVAIDSLVNMDEILDSITADEYRIMRENALKMGKDLKNGKYTKKIVEVLDKM